MSQSPSASKISQSSSFAPPFRWEPGEHLAIVGQTGSGKSTLISALADFRTYSLVLQTKVDDVKYHGHILIRRAIDIRSPRSNKYLLRPLYTRQQDEIAIALEEVWKQGGWTVFADESYYIQNYLRLEKFIVRLNTQGRSLKISMVNGMQRPSLVTRFTISEATHVVTFYLEGRDRQTIEDAGSEDLAIAGEGLQRYQFAWLYRPTREVWVGSIQDLGGLR